MLSVTTCTVSPIIPNCSAHLVGFLKYIYSRHTVIQGRLKSTGNWTWLKIQEDVSSLFVCRDLKLKLHSRLRQHVWFTVGPPPLGGDV